jgi:signal transduction histidine kinase
MEEERMGESYLEGEASGADADGTTLAGELLAVLLPTADVSLLVAGLRARRAKGAGAPEAMRSDDEVEPAERELRRVQRQIALGEAARSARHDLNNPLTALLAEVQLLELEDLAPPHRAAVRRILELTRRIVLVARRLDAARGPAVG